MTRSRSHQMALSLDPELSDLFGSISDLTINWSVLEAAGFSVSRINLSRTSALNLGGVFVAWYRRNGEPVLWPERGVSPVTIGQAAKPNFEHPRIFETKISEKIQAGQFNWTLPAYDVGRGYLLLDGVHRSIAALRACADYSIQLAVIHGPIDQNVLTDLIVFQ
jgi:hypothetical protein